jgi:UDP-glucose 4-epimerase
MSILITGGAGYIGSHIALELSRINKSIIILDNLSQSTGTNVEALRCKYSGIIFLNIDLRDYCNVDKMFNDFHIDSVIHLAGKKYVSESINNPLDYYQNNVEGTLNLLRVMEKHNCYNLIFSSSATVYGIPSEIAMNELSPIKPINPYGHSKAMVEQILQDLSMTPNPWKIISLRYFNPVGLDSSRLLRDESESLPENLFPYLLKVIKGELSELTVFGNDYDTYDGTAIRDYIHISDLAKAHIKSLEYSINEMNEKYQVFNIGTGVGFTVLDIIHTFEKIIEDLRWKGNYSINPLKYKFVPRRKGDVGKSYANANKAYEILGWETEKTLMEMCLDSIY